MYDDVVACEDDHAVASQAQALVEVQGQMRCSFRVYIDLCSFRVVVRNIVVAVRRASLVAYTVMYSHFDLDRLHWLRPFDRQTHHSEEIGPANVQRHCSQIR